MRLGSYALRTYICLPFGMLVYDTHAMFYVQQERASRVISHRAAINSDYSMKSSSDRSHPANKVRHGTNTYAYIYMLHGSKSFPAINTIYFEVYYYGGP